jgi:hypothetical protein
MTDVDPPIELNAIVKIYAESKGNEEKCQRKDARYHCEILHDGKQPVMLTILYENENKWR